MGFYATRQLLAFGGIESLPVMLAAHPEGSSIMCLAFERPSLVCGSWPTAGRAAQEPTPLHSGMSRKDRRCFGGDVEGNRVPMHAHQHSRVRPYSILWFEHAGSE